MARIRASLIGLFLVVSGCSAPPSGPRRVAAPTESTGVLVMAHGGSVEWNRSVQEVVGPLAARVPTVVAYGMADPATLGAGLTELEQRGVRRVVVVRMFLSGESFLEQTRFYLGLSDTPPAHFVLMGPSASDPGARRPLAHAFSVSTHSDGILDAPEAGEIAAARALGVSSDPASESVLLVAHGMGDEGENRRVLEALQRAASVVKRRGFADVEVATLREDWAGPREAAERRIRDYVSGQDAIGRRVLVVPMRLSGFGPYADVLAGLRYAPAEGFLPHAAIGDWVVRASDRVACAAGWGPIVQECPGLSADEALDRSRR